MIIGVTDRAVENVLFENVSITYPGQGDEGTAYMPIWKMKNVPENEKVYPEFNLHDGVLVMSYSGSGLLMAAELMSDTKIWTSKDKTAFKAWVLQVYQKAANEIRIHKNNWADWGRLGSLLAASFLEDKAEVLQNVQLIKSDLFSKIASDGHMSGDEQMREEARASFALASYSAYNKHSKDSLAINYTGIGYESPWLSDSYFDYLSHYMEGIGELPEMIPEGTNHLFYSSSMITNISYAPDKIAYTAYDKNGVEHLKLTFTPTVYANGKPLSKSKWKFGKYRGIDNILTIQRKDVSSIEVHAAPLIRTCKFADRF